MIVTVQYNLNIYFSVSYIVASDSSGTQHGSFTVDYPEKSFLPILLSHLNLFDGWESAYSHKYRTFCECNIGSADRSHAKDAQSFSCGALLCSLALDYLDAFYFSYFIFHSRSLAFQT